MGRRMGIDTVQIAANVAVLRHMMVRIVGLFASISDDVDGLMDQMIVHIRLLCRLSPSPG